MSSHAHRHVERRHSDAIALELGVEGFDGKPVRGYAPHFHPLRIPLNMMIDTVILRIARSIERRPYGTVQQSAGRLEPPQDSIAQHAAEVRQFRQMSLDETEFGRIDADHRELWSLGDLHSGSGFPRTVASLVFCADRFQRRKFGGLFVWAAPISRPMESGRAR